MEPRQREIGYLLSGAFQRLAFTCWGDPHAQPVVCVHGLSRNGRDFDVLARSLAQDFYVLCPDLPGRGRSSWLPDASLYQPLSYVQALSHLLAFIDRPVFWVGTSLGGICGMLLAATPGNPILRMVLNDVGPFVPKASLERIRDYLGDVPEFAGVAEFEAYLRTIHAPFGKLTDAQWAEMASHSHRKTGDGRVTVHYDPAMVTPLRDSTPADMDLWAVWDRIQVPMLTLRGEASDLLLPATFERMASKSATHTVADTGHAPALMDEPTIGVVSSFLKQA